MDLGKFSQLREEEIVSLISLLGQYRALNETIEESDKETILFYAYSIKLVIVRLNELLNGSIPLNNDFRLKFEATLKEKFSNKLDKLDTFGDDSLELAD